MIENVNSEREILSHLDHPAVMTLHESFEDKNKFYIVTEYMKGSSLLDMVQREKDMKE